MGLTGKENLERESFRSCGTVGSLYEVNVGRKGHAKGTRPTYVKTASNALVFVFAAGGMGRRQASLYYGV